MRAVAILALSLVSYASTTGAAPSTTDCPSQFHSIELHADAKLCQVFDASNPASLVYHSKQAPEQSVAFFLNDQRLAFKSKTHQRTLLMNTDKTLRVVVSPDGLGSQIDILVTTDSQ